MSEDICWMLAVKEPKGEITRTDCELVARFIEENKDVLSPVVVAELERVLMLKSL